MTEQYGPSYADVSDAASHLRARSGLLVVFEVLPPVLVSTTGKYTSWTVVAFLRGPDGRPGRVGQVCEQYGRGGSWKTLPAAMHAACLKLAARLDDQERNAKAHAAF